MPRIPLQPIDANRGFGHELTPYKRGQIQALKKIGLSESQIAERFRIGKSTVNYTLQQDTPRLDGQTLPRSGRPPLLTPGDLRLLLRHVRLNPTATYREILRQT